MMEIGEFARLGGVSTRMLPPCWRYHFLEAAGDDETHWIVELQLEL